MGLKRGDSRKGTNSQRYIHISRIHSIKVKQRERKNSKEPSPQLVTAFGFLAEVPSLSWPLENNSKQPRILCRQPHTLLSFWPWGTLEALRGWILVWEQVWFKNSILIMDYQQKGKENSLEIQMKFANWVRKMKFWIFSSKSFPVDTLSSRQTNHSFKSKLLPCQQQSQYQCTVLMHNSDNLWKGLSVQAPSSLKLLNL